MTTEYRIKALEDAAQAVVDRWDSPLWGGSALNLKHTGEYIARLRAALAASQPAQPVAWMAEVHNKYQTRGGYDERIDINEWRQAVTLNEPNGQRYRNIRPLYPAPHPLTVQDAARVVADGLNDGEVWRVAVNGAAAILNSGMPGSYWPPVKQIREALDAALRAIAEGRA